MLKAVNALHVQTNQKLVLPFFDGGNIQNVVKPRGRHVGEAERFHDRLSVQEDGADRIRREGEARGAAVRGRERRPELDGRVRRRGEGLREHPRRVPESGLVGLRAEARSAGKVRRRQQAHRFQSLSHLRLPPHFF